nr:unnamed protein product [Callosobruchus chinensis]
MKVNIDKMDITAAYRVGQKVNNRPRHILITFRHNVSKMSTYNKKRLLKGTKMVIKEDLTTSRLYVLETASDKYGYRNV